MAAGVQAAQNQFLRSTEKKAAPSKLGAPPLLSPGGPTYSQVSTFGADFQDECFKTNHGIRPVSLWKSVVFTWRDFPEVLDKTTPTASQGF